MKVLRKLVDTHAHHFEEGGGLERFAPVWEAAAWAASAWRPPLITMTGLARAAARAADMNLRALVTAST